MATHEEMLALASVIKNETITDANSANRIGTLLQQLVAAINEIELTPGEDGLTAYEVAVADGYVGDQTSWLLSLVGAPGDDGEEVSLQITATHLQWRLGAGSWANLVALADITGDDGEAAIMTRTSSTSLAVGTGSKTFTYPSAPTLGWVYGMRLRASYLGNFMEGIVDSVSSTVVTLIVDTIGGSGTHAGWTIGVAGEKGLIGPNGDFYSFRVFGGVFQIRLSTLTDPEPWINLFYATDEINDAIEATVLESNPNQIGAVGGKATVQTLHIPTNGNVVTFDTFRRYGSPKVPLIGTILNNIIGAKSEPNAIVYYRNAVEPTWPGNWVKLSGTYSTTKLNKIVATYVDELQVSYTIQEVNDFYVGLELWYKFNEGIGATEIIDHSGKSRHLDVVNSTGVNATWNGVGTTEAVEGDYMGGTGANPDNTGGTYWTTPFDTPLEFSSFSVLVWGKKAVGVMTANQTPYYLIMRRTGGASTAYRLQIYSLTTGRLRVGITNDVPTAYNTDIDADDPLCNDGVMKPYIITFDHTTLALNIYGASGSTPMKTATLTGLTGFPLSADAININRLSFSSAARQGGQYGETIFWSKVLSADEIAVLQKRKNSFSPLI